MQDLQLGDRILMQGTVIKWQDYHESDDTQETAYGPASLPKTNKGVCDEGIIIGGRTIPIGHMVKIYEFSDYLYESVPVDREFKQTGSLEVWLISFHMRRKPVMCLDEQVTKL